MPWSHLPGSSTTATPQRGHRTPCRPSLRDPGSQGGARRTPNSSRPLLFSNSDSGPDIPAAPTSDSGPAALEPHGSHTRSFSAPHGGAQHHPQLHGSADPSSPPPPSGAKAPNLKLLPSRTGARVCSTAQDGPSRPERPRARQGRARQRRLLRRATVATLLPPGLCQLHTGQGSRPHGGGGLPSGNSEPRLGEHSNPGPKPCAERGTVYPWARHRW